MRLQCIYEFTIHAKRMSDASSSKLTKGSKKKRVVVDKTEGLKLTLTVINSAVSASRASEISDKSLQSEKLKKGQPP
jgi:hypothetical protein